MLGAVAAGWDGYRRGWRGGRDVDCNDGQRRSRPWDVRQGDSTSS